MNVSYLDSLPEAENKYGVELKEGEKVVLAQNLDIFGNDKDRLLGQKCEFTMTNRRIIVNNGAGIWTIDIAKDISGHRKVTSGFWIFKSTFYAVDLYEKVVYDNGNQNTGDIQFSFDKPELNGYRFYFEAPEMAKFEAIMSNLY